MYAKLTPRLVRARGALVTKSREINVSIQYEGAKPKPNDAVAVAFTLVEAEHTLTKTYTAGPDGMPQKAADAGLAVGTATRVALHGTASDMARRLAGKLSQLTQHQALILAPPPAGRDAWRLVRKDQVGSSDEIARTKEHFQRPPGPALVALDFDAKTYPPAIMAKLRSFPGNLSGVLASVFPAFAGAARVSRASVSAGILNKSSGEQTPADAGLHHYYFAIDGLDAPRFGEALRDRLVLAGWAWGEVSKAGKVLVRTLIDAIVTIDGSRLVYEADGVLADPQLEHVRGVRSPKHREGGLLDTRALPDLAAQEAAELQRIKAEIKATLQSEAEAVRGAWLRERGEELTARGVAPDMATRVLAQAIESQELFGDFTIHLDTGENVTVREILATPAKYHKQTCADPLEPDYGGGRDKAIVYADGQPHIFSHAHGGISYKLRNDPAAFFTDSADDEGGWPEPVDVFGDGDASSLVNVPAGCLPDCIDRYVRDEAERMGVPEAFLALSALTTLSAAVGGQVRIQPKEHDTTWTEPAFLWGLLVEDPGGKKSPVISSATRPLVQLDGELAAADMPKRQAWETEAKKRKKDAPLTPRPRVRRAVVNSFTVEGLRTVLTDNPRGVFVVADEVSGLICGMDQYKQKAGADRADLLQLLNGAPRSVDRVGQSYHLACWGASVIGGIQPKKLAEASSDLDPDGLLQRFIAVLGDGVRRAGVDRLPDQAAIARYERTVRGLAAVTNWSGNFDTAAPVVLSPGAQEMRRRFVRRLDTLRDLPNMSDAWCGHLSKWEGFYCRIVLVFHMAENLDAHGPKAAALPVSQETAERAFQFSSFLLTHALRFYGTVVGLGAGGEAARRAAGIILLLGKSSVTRRDIYDKHRAWRGVSNLSELIGAMRVLSRLGWCSPASSDKDGPDSWNINPQVFERFKDRARSEEERRRRGYAQVQAAVAERRELNAAKCGGHRTGSAPAPAAPTGIFQ